MFNRNKWAARCKRKVMRPDICDLRRSLSGTATARWTGPGGHFTVPVVNPTGDPSPAWPKPRGPSLFFSGNHFAAAGFPSVTLNRHGRILPKRGKRFPLPPGERISRKRSHIEPLNRKRNIQHFTFNDQYRRGLRCHLRSGLGVECRMLNVFWVHGEVFRRLSWLLRTCSLRSVLAKRYSFDPLA